MIPIRLLCASSVLWCLPLSAQDLRGFDPANLDTTVAACSDFYRHANGGWLRRMPVPAGHGSHGLFDEMREAHRQQRLRLLAEIAADPARQGQPLADFIAGGLDEAAIESAGRRELETLLAPTAAIDPPPKRLPPLIATLHTRGLPLLFRAEVAQADDGPHLRLLAGGLGLPDRDYYLREDAPARALLGHYRGYVERLLTLAGSSDPANDAAWVLDAELRLARGWPAAGGNAAPLTASVRDLQRRFPAIDWRGWLAANGLARQPRLTLAEPAYFEQLNQLIGSGPPAQWRAYLRFQIAHLMAPFLGHEFVAVHDDFFQRTLRGRSVMPTRAERVLEITERVLGPAVEEAVGERQLPPASRAAADQLVADLRSSLRSGLAGAAWLPDQAARNAAVERLDQLSIEIASPGAGVAFGELRFDRSRHADNVLRAAAHLHRERLARLQRRGSTRDAETTPVMAAQYDPRSNKLQLGLGVLAPPLFDPDGDPALTYGSLGALVGHELLHGFDLAGAAWAGETPDAARIAAYEAHTAPLRVQYAGYRSIGDRPVDGQRTLAENAADLAGLELAWAAWQQRQGAALPADGAGPAPAQRFFLGWAQMWRRNYRDEELIRRLRQDPQPPSEFRVNGPLPHLDGFAAAFGCGAADPMHLAPEARLRMFR